MSVQTKTPDKKIATIDTAQRTSKTWREPRYAPFIEQTKTEEVPRQGKTAAPLERHALVALRVVGAQEFCSSNGDPVTYMVARAKRTGDVWLTGASKIQAESLWDLSSQAAPQEELPPPREDQNAAQYTAVDKMEEAELDALSYGAIQGK